FAARFGRLRPDRRQQNGHAERDEHGRHAQGGHEPDDDAAEPYPTFGVHPLGTCDGRAIAPTHFPPLAAPALVRSRHMCRPRTGYCRRVRPRAVLVAAIVGAVLVSANVYRALPVGFTETATLLTATMAVALARLARRPLAPEETFLAQAFASCAGMCTAASGLSSVVPALAAAGQAPSGWA